MLHRNKIKKIVTISELAEQSAKIKHVYQVTPDVYYSFQRCSNDYNPLHTDEAVALNKGFTGKVMYGNILNAFVSHFVGMLLPSRDVMIQAQELNFMRPVYLNDEVELEGTVYEVSDTAGVIDYKLRFRRVGGGTSELVARGHVKIGMM